MKQVANGSATDSVRLALADEIRLAARAIAQVRAGHHLPTDLLEVDSEALGAADEPIRVPDRSRAAVRDMAYRAVREMGRCEYLLSMLNSRPVSVPVLALQLVALEQLLDPMRDTHTIVNQAVEAAKADPQTLPAAGLINAVLRRFLREREALMEKANSRSEAVWNFPFWWIDLIRKTYPDSWKQVLTASNSPAPMVLRVNQRRSDTSHYQGLLASAGIGATVIGTAAIRLHRPMDVTRLPGFAEGLVSVQDLGAQLACPLLAVVDGMRVLDACAAPGGKSAHLLESAAVRLTALDSEPARLERLGQTLARLGLVPEAVLAGDAGRPDEWWDGEPYDRILVDAPCTASGIVRRHPEVRWLRRRRDIETFAAQQTQILTGLWPTLKPGGKLLYATCSVFAAEGEGVISGFLNSQPRARRRPLEADIGSSRVQVDQLLPSAAEDRDHDGFFYAQIEKLR